MQKLIIDTDIGDDIDDALALAFALLRPELDVRAITTVSGRTEKRTHIVKKLLKVMECRDISVGAGMPLPLRSLSEQEYARFMDCPAGGYCLNHYSVVKPEEIEDFHAPRDGVELIIDTVAENAGDIAIASLGPLTNIAVALQKAPDIRKKLKWIALMGGEVHLNRREHNIAWDPYAAELVFSSGVPIFMGTWDVTRRFTLLPEQCAAVRKCGTPLCGLLAEMMEGWWPHKGWKPGPVMYDIAPVVWSFDRSYYTTKPMQIQVENRGEFTRGMTVPGSGNANAEVTVDMRAGEVEKLFMDTLCGNRTAFL